MSIEEVAMTADEAMDLIIKAFDAVETAGFTVLLPDGRRIKAIETGIITPNQLVLMPPRD